MKDFLERNNLTKLVRSGDSPAPSFGESVVELRACETGKAVVMVAMKHGARLFIRLPTKVVDGELELFSSFDSFSGEEHGAPSSTSCSQRCPHPGSSAKRPRHK